jgi:DNA-binding GntR family transcriptional regulator
MAKRENVGVKKVDISQSEKAYRVLSEQIVTLKIAPGSIMVEQELIAASGFGRTPVREALQKLERDMLIQILPRRGILIEPIDFERPLMALDVRVRVECLIMERAARLSSDMERRLFERIALQMEASLAANDPVAFAELDQNFDNHALQCARHEVAARVLQPLHAIGRRIGFHEAISNPSIQKNTVQLHINLARAVAKEDLPSVCQYLEGLFAASRQTLLTLGDIESINVTQIRMKTPRF